MFSKGCGVISKQIDVLGRLLLLLVYFSISSTVNLFTSDQSIQFTGCSMQNSVYYGPSPNILALQTLIVILLPCPSISLSPLLVSFITQ